MGALGEEHAALKEKVEHGDHDTLMNKYQAGQERANQEVEAK